MFDILWQMTSRDTDDIFGILRDDETFLSTVLLPAPEVLARYETEEAATAGHNELAKKYNLR